MPEEKSKDIKEAAYEYASFLYDLYADALESGIISIGQNNANHNINDD